jgi:signal transduction histidine kinase/ligand-binding sensor domain-containing protein/DNA-binding response OmpR family regulator
MRFERLSTDHGLSQNMIFDIIQDQTGFLWVATKDGLNRYDGYTFRVFRFDPFDTTSLAEGEIGSLYIDSRGRLWAGSKGISLYNPVTESFRRYLSETNFPNIPIDVTISNIHETPGPRKGEFYLWLSTNFQGIYRGLFSDSNDSTNPVLKELEHFTHQPDNYHSLTSDTIHHIITDLRDNTWISTDNGLNLVLPSCDLHNSVTDAVCFKRYNTVSNDKDGLLHKHVGAMVLDADGNVLIGTRGGVSRLVLLNGNVEFEHYPYPLDFSPFPWSRTVNSLFLYDERTLWLGLTSGLGILDMTNGSYRFIYNNPQEPTSLSFNGIQSIYRDRGAIIWIGTSGKGLNKFDPKTTVFNLYRGEIGREPYLSTLSAGVLFDLIDNDGNKQIWFSSGNTLFILDRPSGEIRKFTPDKYLPFDFYGIIQDRAGKLWIATHVGIYLYNPNDGSVQHLPVNPTIADVQVEDRVYSIFEDNNGTIWAATSEYLSRYDPSTHSFHHDTMPWNNSNKPVITEVRSIYQDARPGSTSLWLGSNRGFARFDTESETVYVFPAKPVGPDRLNYVDINCITGDPFEPWRYLWIGTRGGGLYRYDIDEDVFRHYTTENGLPNNVVYGLLPDQEGNLWLSTNNGLSKFNPRSDTFRNYDVNDGLQSNEFNTRSYHRSGDGELFFGGIDGINSFYPEMIGENTYIPPVVLTDFQINYESVAVNNNVLSPQNSTITTAEEICLLYNQNVLSFEITALDFTIASKNQYAYMLENFHDDWIYSGTDRRANFSNLPPGKYIFRAKASNNDGHWNEEGMSIGVVILPPPWRTWWAYTFYVITGIWVLYVLRRYELNRLRLKNRLHIERIEAENLREIDRTKSRFFANVSHELRTPLTLILGSLERMKNLDAKENSSSHHDLIERNTRRLIELINQLLDLARLETGHLKMHYIHGDIKKFIRRIVNLFTSFAEQRRILLDFIADDSPIDTHFDPDKIEKICNNLISNALKFSPSGEIVSVSVRISNNISGSEDFVELRVENTGVGIPDDQLKKIFDRFYRVPNTPGDRNQPAGIGIGLSLVKELVELHKGTISAESVEDKKTVFTVRLPIVTDDEEPNSEPVPAYDSAVKGSIHSTAVQPSDTVEEESPSNDVSLILLVEDNRDIRGLIREHLDHEYSVIEATNGIRGRDIAFEKVPDLIVCDVMMPEMNGYELCDILKNDERTSHIPIIMLTARAGFESKIMGLEYGADDYLVKPFSGKELRVRVKNLIEQRLRLRKRYSETPLIPVPGSTKPVSIDEQFLTRVTGIVETHLSDEMFDVMKLARETGLSHSQLHRKLTALTGKSASQFIRSIRLSHAADLLRQNAGNIAEIAFRVGFNSQAYFTKCFNDEFGSSPSEYKKHMR